jgi:hypothetical protein
MPGCGRSHTPFNPAPPVAPLTSGSLDSRIPQGYQGVRPKVMLMYLLNERNQLG